MAPAPKSRVPKGKIIEEPPMASQLIKDEQIDAGGTQPSSPPLSSNLSRRRSSVEAPPLRFQLRKQNADSSSNASDAWITQRGATDEIREHLKHLGPSNLASRPRQTRYHNVKIKRSTSPSRSAQTEPDPVQNISDSQRQHLLSDYDGGIGAGLVGSGAEAKDGIHALRHGYGTISSPDPLMTNGASPQYKDPPHVSIPEPVHEEREDQARSGSHKGSSGTGSIQSTDSPPGSIYHHGGPDRSGSITEQVVDVNGVRKVVLHTNNGNGNVSSEGESSSRQSESGEDLIRL